MLPTRVLIGDGSHSGDALRSLKTLQKLVMDTGLRAPHSWCDVLWAAAVPTPRASLDFVRQLRVVVDLLYVVVIFDGVDERQKFFRLIEIERHRRLR